MKPSTTFSRMRTNAGVSSRFGRWIRKQPNEPHQEPRVCYGDLMRGGRMKLRTGAASLPTPASPPSLSFSNHWFFFSSSKGDCTGSPDKWSAVHVRRAIRLCWVSRMDNGPQAQISLLYPIARGNCPLTIPTSYNWSWSLRK